MARIATKKIKKNFDLEDVLTIEEDADATLEQEVQAIQRAINSGAAWNLQGSYGRTAMNYIENGYCTVGLVAHKDFYGNTVPSQDQLEAGTKGTIEYCRAQQPDYWQGRADDHSLTTK